MIKDRIKENALNYAEVVFLTIDNEEITYQEFDNYVYCIELFINSQKILPKKINIACLNKKNILASIIACNRINAIPVISPPDCNKIKFLDYKKIADFDFEINDKDCIIQHNEVDEKKEIFYNRHDVQCVLFTSGTEMKPKAVELTFGNIYNSAINWNEVADFNSSDVYLNILPLWHISGLSIFFRSIYFNFHSVLLEYNKEEIFLMIEKFNINCISVVPKIIFDLFDKIDNKKYFKNLKIVIVGGDGINEKIFDYFKKNNINAYISYGMTETSSGICGYFVHDINNYMQGFLGFPHKNTYLSINNGHIKIQSKSVMKKYVNNEDCYGMFLSEDLGIKRKNKFFYKSRSSNFIVSGGENINLQAIKNVILGLDCNIEMKVEGIVDDKWGQACSVSIKKSNFNIDEIRSHCKKYLPKYMVPKYFINKQELEYKKK
tara:strand:+ start:5288 stop:6589 length:1302 start_codon:yes stop_codon:yes gene_type:complete